MAAKMEDCGEDSAQDAVGGRSNACVQVDPDTRYPDRVYERLFGERRRRNDHVKGFNQIRRHPKKDHIRIVAISDTHNKLGRILDGIPPCDILIHAGDFTYNGSYAEIRRFNDEMGKLKDKCKHRVVIAGNHEIPFDPATAPHCPDKDLRSAIAKGEIKRPQDLLTNCIYLQDSGVELLGVRIWGSPWQPTFCGWAFNRDRGPKLLERWDLVPSHTDVLVTHGPPLGHGDLAKTGTRAGCVELLSTVERRVRPSHHIFGHIHEGYGVTTNGTTTFINASVCTQRYSPTNDPIVFDLPKRRSRGEKVGLGLEDLSVQDTESTSTRL